MTAKIRSLLPTKVNILGVEYDVVIRPDEYFDDKERWGEWTAKTRTIDIVDMGGNPETIWGHLIHEVFHGLLYHSGLDQLLNGDMQEALCALSENIAKSGIILTARKPLKE